MRVLCSETSNKSARSFLTISKEVLLERIKTDHGYHEVIPMIDNNIVLRLFIDIDTSGDPDEVLKLSLEALNKKFNTLDSDWAICSCNRESKVSYHILSKKYSMTLNSLRKLNIDMSLDKSVYYFDMNDHEDNGYFRLPNQTKNSINKPAPHLKVLQGDLSDFLVTQTDGLTLYAN